MIFNLWIIKPNIAKTITNIILPMHFFDNMFLTLSTLFANLFWFSLYDTVVL